MYPPYTRQKLIFTHCFKYFYYCYITVHITVLTCTSITIITVLTTLWRNACTIYFWYSYTVLCARYSVTVLFPYFLYGRTKYKQDILYAKYFWALFIEHKTFWTLFIEHTTFWAPYLYRKHNILSTICRTHVILSTMYL